MSYVKLLSFENVAIQVTHNFNETKIYRKSTAKCNTVGVEQMWSSLALLPSLQISSNFPNNDCSLSNSGYHSLINKPRVGFYTYWHLWVKIIKFNTNLNVDRILHIPERYRKLNSVFVWLPGHKKTVDAVA